MRLAFASKKPVSFKFGETYIMVSSKWSNIDKEFADLIAIQFPTWIELASKKPAAKKAQIPPQA